MKINFLKFYHLFFGVSFIIFLVLGGAILFKGFSYGTDFTGGIELIIIFEEPKSSGDLIQELQSAGLSPEIEEIVSRENTFKIRHLLIEEDPVVTENKFQQVLEELYSDEFELGQIHLIGGILSSQNKSNALIISMVVILLIVFYITLRFNFSYSIASIIAVIHDIIIMLGFVLFMGFEMQVLVIIAVLTVFGYSVNDSIVLFDRVREKKKDQDIKVESYRELLNLSINSVLSRTLITSFTTLIVVSSLYFSTEGSYKNFAAILIVGIFSGTYSSIYIACSVLILWDKKKPLLTN